MSDGDAGIIIRVLDGPAPSLEPVWPQPLLVLLPCALLGLLAGLVLTAWLDRPGRVARVHVGEVVAFRNSTRLVPAVGSGRASPV